MDNNRFKNIEYECMIDILKNKGYDIDHIKLEDIDKLNKEYYNYLLAINWYIKNNQPENKLILEKLSAIFKKNHELHKKRHTNELEKLYNEGYDINNITLDDIEKLKKDLHILIILKSFLKKNQPENNIIIEKIQNIFSDKTKICNEEYKNKLDILKNKGFDINNITIDDINNLSNDMSNLKALRYFYIKNNSENENIIKNIIKKIIISEQDVNKITPIKYSYKPKNYMIDLIKNNYKNISDDDIKIIINEFEKNKDKYKRNKYSKINNYISFDHIIKDIAMNNNIFL